MKQKKSRKKRRTTFLMTLIKLLCVVALVFSGYYVYAKLLNDPLIDSLDVEAGSNNLDARSFLRQPEKYEKYECKLAEPFTWEESKILGPHKIKIILGKSTYSTTVNIVDTTKPIILGVRKLKAKIGESVLYKKGVTVNDNAEGDVKLDVDVSQVDYSKVGTYNVTYKATDASKNTATRTTTLQLVKFSDAEKAYKDSMARAKATIKKITKSTDTKAAKMRKCFMWCAYVKYITPREFPQNFLEGSWPATYADDCFINYKGDCHSSAAAFAYMCEALGYKDVKLNQDKRHSGDGAHSWVTMGGYVYDPLFYRIKSKAEGWKCKPEKFRYKSMRSRTLLVQ